jgi:hypothetical protein
MAAKCTVCNGRFTRDEVRKQVYARAHPRAISKGVVATVHERCLEAYKRQATGEHGPNWVQEYGVEFVDAWGVG